MRHRKVRRLHLKLHLAGPERLSRAGTVPMSSRRWRVMNRGREQTMEIDARLSAIEEGQREILKLLSELADPSPSTMPLKQAAAYSGYSSQYFRRLAVEQRIIPFSRPSGQQKGKLLFRKSDLDAFLDSTKKEEKKTKQRGRKRKSKDICLW